MKRKTIFEWGLAITLSACAVLLFYDTLFQHGRLLVWISSLLHVLKPVLYGVALAYLLAPIVNFFDRFLRCLAKSSGGEGLIRAGSILLTWVLVGVCVYGIFSLLLPSLVDSVAMLIGNLESYYKIVYSWVTELVENNPHVSDKVLETVRSYYNELINWVYNTLIPQAQVAIVAVTGGIWSVVLFVKDLLIGMIVSVYLLATKETLALHARRLLYSALRDDHYRMGMRGIKTVDGIFSGFVRGKLLDSLIIGILCFIGCSLLKFPYTPIISVFVGVTNVIPVFGPFLGAVPSAFLILLVSPRQCLYFVIFILVLQQFDGNILGPAILGKSTGLSSFWVIVAILVGGSVGGILGMFLGVPVLACLYTGVSTLCQAGLRRKGYTDDAVLYDHKPIPPAAETNEEAKK